MERRIFLLAGALPIVVAFGAIIVGLGLVVFGDNGSDTKIAQGSTASPTGSAGTSPTPAPRSSEQTGHAWLGVGGVTAEAGGAVEVTDVVDGSPADDAGIVKGDFIHAVDGEAMASFRALASLIRTHSPSDTVTITIEHDGDTNDVEVRLGERPVSDLPDIGGGLLPDLGGIFDGFSLDRLIGGQLQYLDADGNIVTLSADAGDITSISSDSITIHPPQGGDKTFDLPADAHVPNLVESDQVIVISKNGDVTAVISTDLAKLFPLDRFPRFHPNGDGNFDGDFLPDGIMPHCMVDENGVNCEFNATATPAPLPNAGS